MLTGHLKTSARLIARTKPSPRTGNDSHVHSRSGQVVLHEIITITRMERVCCVCEVCVLTTNTAALPYVAALLAILLGIYPYIFINEGTRLKSGTYVNLYVTPLNNVRLNPLPYGLVRVASGLT